MKPPAKLLIEGLDRFERTVLTVLELLIEEQAISEAGSDTEIRRCEDSQE